ncbi:helix-turn-helix domain-containing protein [Pseudomonas sp. T8]|uniref:helix-turn-helix domain-containing protein n=1 Tax=Pseudomonas sp. T8 TaxID=645292 RepID=UPI0021495A42|nr:helix-turn-helix domain-containing protein [Pseudomonas sp. T8]UUT24118.1 helix-turn-helix domain-containing protein [Pseudomonas sp. T8]
MSDIRRRIADEINCYTAEDISELAKVKMETLEYWRKKGKGPKAIHFGSAYLYPKASVMEFIAELTKGPSDDFIRRCI